MVETVQNTSQASILNIGNGLSLGSGGTPKIIPLLVDLTVSQNVLIDLTQQQQGGHIGPIQTIYIDNTGNGQSVTVNPLVSNAAITIPAGDGAILPFFLPGTAPKFTVASTGGTVIPIYVLDVPLPAVVWGASFGGATFQTVNGYVSMNVVDTALQGLISNIGGAGNALDVNVLTGGGGSSGVESVILFAGQITASGETNFGGSAGKNMTITGWEFSVSNDAACSAGASSATIGIVDNGGGAAVTFESQVYIGNTTVVAPNPGATIISRMSNPDGLHTNPNVGDGSGIFWNGNALTTGKFNCNIYGFYT